MPTNGATQRKVSIIDPYPAFSAGIAGSLCNGFLSDEGQVVVSNEKTDSSSQASVCVIDIRLAGIGSSFSVIRDLKQQGTHVLVCAPCEYLGLADQVYKAGAKGFVTKESSIEDLRQAVTTVANGEIFLPEYVAQSIAKIAVTSTVSALSKKEFQCFILMARGYTNLEIAREMGFSTKHPQNKQVFTLCKAVEEKLGVSRQADVTRLAIRLQVLEP